MKHMHYSIYTMMITMIFFACNSQEAKPSKQSDQEISDQNTTDQEISDQNTTDQRISDQNTSDQQLPHAFELSLWQHERINSHDDQPNFQNIFQTVSWGDGPFEKVTLTVDLESSCFPFESWSDDPPPMGQNWPPLCDAFDRNFEITMDDPKAQTDPIGIELVRAITPFGGPMHFEIDLTDLANGLPGEHRFKTHITTYSDGSGQVSGQNGGWWVSAKIQVKRGPAPRQVLQVIPLFNDTYPQLLNQESKQFDIHPQAQKVEIHYRATGHGGGNDPSVACIGPAEEFCKRTHVIEIDGQSENFQPWRDDCQNLCTLTTGEVFGRMIQYCAENPMGSIDSVRAPRANWCPGSITAPKIFEIMDRSAANHQFSFKIANAFQERGWRISTVVMVFGQ
jgi:hypothetical protein